jgi:hypothetical protein
MRLKLTVTLGVCLLLTFFSDGLAQQKRRTAVKKQPTDRHKPIDTPCGVHYNSLEDFLDEIKDSDQWVLLGHGDEQRSYYRPSDVICAGRALKVWVKVVPTIAKGLDYDYALDLFELKCPSYEYRITSHVEYDPKGNVLKSLSTKEAEWEDIVPDSLSQIVLKTACRYK